VLVNLSIKNLHVSSDVFVVSISTKHETKCIIKVLEKENL